MRHRRTKAELNRDKVVLLDHARVTLRKEFKGKPIDQETLFVYAFEKGWDARARALNRNKYKSLTYEYP